MEGWVDLGTAVEVHSPCPRLYIAAAVTINITATRSLPPARCHMTVKTNTPSTCCRDSLGVDCQPVGNAVVQAHMYARTYRPTTRKHTASSAIYWMGGSTEMLDSYSRLRSLNKTRKLGDWLSEERRPQYRQQSMKYSDVSINHT